MATINTTDPKPGFVYDLDTDTWFPLLGLATQSLDGLTDVVITTPSTGQILAYNGTDWINQTETGDISAVTSGTGITVTNGTGPIPSVAIDTTVTADLSTAQTLTTKTIALGSNTISGTTAQFNTANTDADFATLAGTETLTNKTLTSPSLTTPALGVATATSINDTTIPTSKTLVATDSTVTAGTTATAASGLGYMGLPQNTTTTGAATIAAADAGKHIYSTATRTLTIDSNANLALPVGTAITFVAGSGATVTIAITTDTMYLAGPGTTGSRTLAAFGMATAVKIASTTWIISGNGLT